MTKLRNAQRGSSGIRPIVNGYVSTKDEYADIVRIAGLLHEQGTAWEDICVLAATKEELSGIADAATRAGIPSFPRNLDRNQDRLENPHGTGFLGKRSGSARQFRGNP